MGTTEQIEWRLTGEEIGHCNCAWGCPCQFNANPTNGNCHALIGFEIREGHFGEVAMDGVRWADIVSWPGAIHEGNGTIQLIVDERANDEQRDALIELAGGNQGGAYFEIFASVLPHVREPIIAPIEFEVDRERRVASLRVGDIADGRAEPIKNPVDGSEHRARIDLPGGFEYTIAEVANSVQVSVRSEDPLSFTLENTYAQLNEFDWSNAA
jgi:hypothetical protein